MRGTARKFVTVGLLFLFLAASSRATAPPGAARWDGSISVDSTRGPNGAVTGSASPPSSIIDSSGVWKLALYNEHTNWVYAESTVTTQPLASTVSFPLTMSGEPIAYADTRMPLRLTGYLLPTDSPGMHVSMWSWTTPRGEVHQPVVACKWVEDALGAPAGGGGRVAPTGFRAAMTFEAPGEFSVPTPVSTLPWVRATWQSNREVVEVRVYAVEAVENEERALPGDRVRRPVLFASRAPELFGWADREGGSSGSIVVDWEHSAITVVCSDDSAYFRDWPHWVVEVFAAGANAGWVMSTQE